MALPSLATVADLEARGVTVSTEEETIVTTFLAVASSTIRDAAGAPISETTSTITLEGSPGAWLHLPGKPVTAVSDVLIDGSAVPDYSLRSGSLWRLCGWQTGYGPSQVTVTYTHGLPNVPADIVDLTCRLAAVALSSQRSGSLETRPVVSERIGDYSATYAYDSLFTESELPDYVRSRLAARFGNGATVVNSR